MLENTNTSYAPWTSVPATNKYYRTYRVFKVIIDTLERALGAETTVWPTIEELESRVVMGESQASMKQKGSSHREESVSWEYVAKGTQEEE